MRPLTQTQTITVQLLLLLSTALLVVGIFSPLIYLSKFWIFNSQTSLMSAIQQLIRHQEWLLGGIIFLFSVLFPIAKNLLTFWLLRFPERPSSGRWKQRLSALGKWSMLDVFIVALLVSAAKLGAIAHAETRYGLYLLLSATLLSLAISSYLDAQWRPKNAHGQR